MKQSRIELLMRKYELFEMSDKETMMEMYARFTHITNELKSIGKFFTTEELVRKILSLGKSFTIKELVRKILRFFASIVGSESHRDLGSKKYE